MFAALFAFALMTAHASEIPSYVHPCGRTDPNYDQCIAGNINNIKDKICTGLPEFDLSPSEPLMIDKVFVYDTNDLKLYFTDGKIYDFCDFVVNSVRTTPDRLHFEFDAILKKIRIEGLYDFDIHLLVNLANKGPVTITADDVGLKINIDAKEITKNGKKQIYASKVNTHLNVTDAVKYEFGDTKKELVQLHQALRNVVDSNIKDVVDSIVLVVQKNISELTIKIFNYISRSNYEKLFADKV